MKRLVPLLAAAAIAAPAAAHDYKAGDLTIDHPRSRPAAVGMSGVGYLTVSNTGSRSDVLLKVETPAAEKVEIHQGAMAGNVWDMAELPKGMPIPPGGTATFAPMGNHLMMVRLKKALKNGDKIPATLVFQRAGRVEVEFVVQGTPPTPMRDMPMH